MTATIRFAALALAAVVATPAAMAQSVTSYEAKGSFEDAKADLLDAIVNRGFVNDYKGNVGAMLDRTGADVGSTKPVYKAAEYFTFCSAKLSRAAMEADPLNMAVCPYVVFAYETAGSPGKVVVGYRRPPSASDSAPSKAAVAAIEKLLDEVVKEAAR